MATAWCVGFRPGATRSAFPAMLMVVCSVMAASLLVCSTGTRAEAVDVSDVHRKIRYHLHEMKAGIQELRRVRIHKRSASPNYDEILFRSLESFCSQLYSHNATQPEDNRPEDGLLSTNLSHWTGPNISLSNWTGPNIYPVQVEAERKGHRVHLVFYVVHTGPATLSKTGYFDYSKTPIDYPAGKTGPVMSRVQTSFDASGCVEHPLSDAPSYGNAQYVFSMGTDDPYFVQTIINACGFDRFKNSSEDEFSYSNNPNEWQKKEGVVVQKIPSPRLTVSPDPRMEMVLEYGENVTLEFELNLEGNSQMTFLARVWDKKKGKLLKAQEGLMASPDGTLRLAQHMSSSQEEEIEEGLMSVHISNGTNTITNTSSTFSASAKVTVTLNFAQGGRSGRLDLGYGLQEYNRNSPNIVPFTYIIRKFLFRLPGNAKPLPVDSVDFLQHTTTLHCDKEGNKNQAKEAKNCTVTCQAFGPGLKKIVLRKASRYRKPVRSVAYVQGEAGFAMLDMGPASPSIEGRYKCVVFTSKGKKIRQDIHLYTSLFTNVSQLSVQDFHNGTSQVTCIAEGQQPLNLSVMVHKSPGGIVEAERLDTQARVVNIRTVTGNRQNLTFNVETNLLRFPARYFRCLARGVRGDDAKEEYLWDMVSRYYAEPEVNRSTDATYIYQDARDKVSIYCEAAGKPPMNMSLFLESREGMERIDQSAEGYSRNVTSYDHVTILTVTTTVQTLENARYGYMRCQATNAYGDDRFTFSIHTRTRS